VKLKVLFFWNFRTTIERYLPAVGSYRWKGNNLCEGKLMKNNSLMLPVVPLVGLGVLWFLAPSLAVMAGVVLGLFAIACWREGVGIRPTRLHNSVSVDDF
jgi:hypothetical protein